MNSLRTMQLLLTAAKELRRERETFSKSQIDKKIKEIKYLSAQKKVPKLTIRKEIIHLENQFKGIIELEKKVLTQKSKESKKITSLKRQVTMLKNKLHAAENKDLGRKVEKLSHLLGEYLAKCGTKEDVILTKKILKDLKIKTPEIPKVEEVGKKIDPDLIQKAEDMQKRLNALKHEIVIHKELETKNPEEIEAIENKVRFIQDKLKKFYDQHPELAEVDVLEYPKLKHKLEFNSKKESREFESLLPLPPPPRIGE